MSRFTSGSWEEVRLSSLIREVKRPVSVVHDAEYREIGIRSHGRGIFHKEPAFGSDLGDKAVFWIEPDDLIFNIVFAWEGAVALAGPNETGYIGSHRFPTFRVFADRADPKFLLYFFQTEAGVFRLGENSPGGAGRNRTLDRARLLKEKVRVPDLATQQKLVGILDAKVGAIDRALARTERLRTLLLERQHSLIAASPGRTSTPSSNLPEWLDTMPEPWSTSRARFLFRQLQLPPVEGEGVVTAFRDGQVTLRGNRRADGFMLAVQELGYQRVREGDLVVHSMDAFAGASGVSESTGKCSPEYVVLEATRNGLNNHYYAACLRWMAAEGYIVVICPSVRERAPRLRFSTIKDIVLPVPPIPEQTRIADELQRARRTVERVRGLEEFLIEYRQTIIENLLAGDVEPSSSESMEAA
jgi:type I restriction enzyme S subunit